MAAVALVGLPLEKAMEELHGRFREILKREGLSPQEISYLRGKIEGWSPEYAEGWAVAYAKGMAESRADGILRTLKWKGIHPPDDIRERITTCTDLDTLTHWFDRAWAATDARDLFT